MPLPWTSPWLRAAGTWLAYLLCGGASVALTASDAMVSPLYLAAGVGLACALAWGPWMAAAVGLGAVVVGAAALWTLAPQTAPLTLAAAALANGVGAAGQVLLAAVLTRRVAGTAALLDRPREITLFLLLAGPVASVVNAAVSVTSLVLLGLLPQALALNTFVDWWSGDTLGVLVGTPLVLTLIGQPATVWRQRRKVVGVPLLVTAVVVTLVLRQVQVWEEDRAQRVFHRDTDGGRFVVDASLRGYLNALESLNGLFVASQSVEASEFRHAAAYWLRTLPGIQGIGWDERLKTAEIPSFEARQQADGFPGYKVFDTRDRLPPSGEELVVVRFIEPVAGNERALGYNVLSAQSTREAFEQARREDKVVATAAMTLNQETGTQRGVVVYRTVYDGEPHTPRQRVQASRGAVFLALRMDDTLAAMLKAMPAYLRTCLVDVSKAPPTWLAGDPRCQQGRPWEAQAYRRVVPVGFAARDWELVFWADGPPPSVGQGEISRLMAGGSMVLAAALAGLLLAMTGHTRRLEAAMQEASAQKQAADAANRAKSEFLSRMSHELRTPLNAVLGFAQVMELDAQHPLPDSQRQRVQQIQHAGWHLLAMIDDVLDISRIDAGTLQLHMAPVGLRNALHGALDLVAPLAQRQGIELEGLPPVPPDWAVQADATRLRQVLVNLLSNAVKYNRPGGRVRLSVRAVPAADGLPEGFEVAVSDTGVGMSEVQLAQLFQPFNRLGRERSSVDGTGIGLVISRHLMQCMGGELAVRSVEGKGSTFTARLLRASVAPASASAPSPATAQVAPPPATAAAQPAVAPGRHVLYVEDNQANSAVVRSALASRPWIQLTVSPTIEEALAVVHNRLTQRPPDLILLDVHLPDASGLELLHLLKANPETRDTPVIMISADAMPEQIDAALAAGAACYLTKPVQVAALLVQVDELLLGP
jgi:signal transduction histidine kinase/CheY-like chemotaxis protein